MNLSRFSAEFTGVSLGSRYWSTCDLGRNGEVHHLVASPSGYSSPSLLVPRYAGEPIRFDTWYPTHPRGSGRTRPTESVVDLAGGVGRFPLAAVWSGRRLADVAWEWCSVADTSVSVRPVDAVAVAYRSVVARYKGRKAAVVIPNDFQQSEQQRVLDEINQIHPDTQLLWLPVAAALAWLEGFNKAEWDGLVSGMLGDLVVLHCDWGHLQCSRLELRSIDRQSAVPIVPARRRPVLADRTVCGFGWTLIESGGELVPHWERVFASDVSRPIDSLFGTGVDAYRSNAQSNWLRQLSGWSVPQQPVAKALEELIDHLENLPASPFGVLVVGDFAQLVAKELNRCTESGRLSIQQQIAVYSGLEGERLLAHGAAVHRARQTAGEISYYDSLPEIELFVDRRGTYEWTSLLGDSEHFVQGGVPWELPEPIVGFEMRRGSSQVKLVLAHEEYNGVRELVSSFDESHEQRTPVILHVSCMPAQGNARLRLVTAPQEGGESREVLANWQRMTLKTDARNRPIDKQEYLRSQPRAFPELTPRLASESKWWYAKLELQRILDQAAQGRLQDILDDTDLLKEIVKRLRQKDQSLAPQDATAIGSDFRCPLPSQQALLENATNALLDLWRSNYKTDSNNVNFVIRALGYVSVNNGEFEGWLASPTHLGEGRRQAIEHTCGLVLRDPTHIALFISNVFSSSRSLPRPNPLKAVSQILRYRANATAELPSELCAEVIKTCLRHFQLGVTSGGGTFVFRWSSLIIVYMLRRRMFDPDFLEPTGALATSAKDAFTDAIQRCRSGQLRPITGSVDLPAALEQMINYVDRQGSGDILMAAEGD